ncbi:regulatory protein Rha [Sphaerotilus hippei]|uniref:Regulatory protein Rha n=1 Tax=Sphaerotilus hippei TaxID=744406 RepID=A0A318H368_9BURK|nr:Rha family transcriptional regulator [Sphaerotilus hippei]PXW95434.1 regulatory protein Rha [Sphaerotilus hippei]
MSSREIAELTGKRHDHVLRDIREMLDDLGGDVPSFGGISQDAYGRPLKVFNLPHRETMILVTGYSVVLRAKVVDRWQELEAKVAAPAAPEALRSKPDPRSVRLR